MLQTSPRNINSSWINAAFTAVLILYGPLLEYDSVSTCSPHTISTLSAANLVSRPLQITSRQHDAKRTYRQPILNVSQTQLCTVCPQLCHGSIHRNKQGGPKTPGWVWQGDVDRNQFTETTTTLKSSNDHTPNPTSTSKLWSTNKVMLFININYTIKLFRFNQHMQLPQSMWWVRKTGPFHLSVTLANTVRF